MKKLNEITVTEELLEKAAKCTSPDDLVALAKENDVALSIEEAKELLKKDIVKQKLTDAELDLVTGGAGEYDKMVFHDDPPPDK